MPKYCAVLNCRQEQEKGVSFLRFPQDSRLKQRWVAAIGRLDYKPAPTSVICSKHFEDSDFTYRFGVRTLRKGLVPTIFNNKLDKTTDKQSPKLTAKITAESSSKPQKSTEMKNSYYIPQYVLVHRKFINENGSLDIEAVLKGNNLLPPVIVGIGNTSTTVTSPDVISSLFLKQVQTEEENIEKSKALRDVKEIHSYTKNPDDSLDGTVPCEGNEKDPCDENEKDPCEENEKDLCEEKEKEAEEYEECIEVLPTNTLQKRRRLISSNGGDSSLSTLKNPPTSKIVWNVIQRTLGAQRKKIKSLESEHSMLQNQLKSLEDNIREIVTSKNKPSL